MKTRTEHLKMLISMMGSTTSAGDGEAINAFRMASRELDKHGLTWRDIAEKALNSSELPRTSGIWKDDQSHQNTSRAKEDMASSPPPPPKEPEKIRLTGFEIPAAISGIVSVLDDDKKSGIIIIEVIGKENIYGPMIAYTGTIRENLVKAHNRHGTLRVRPPRNEMSMAQIVSCRYI